MEKQNIYPTLQYKPSLIYNCLTPENFKELSDYMKESQLFNLLVTPENWLLEDDEAELWNLDYLPDMSTYSFIKRLDIESTKISDLNPIHCCKSIEVLSLNNGDKTKIDFSCFPKLKEFYSWDRKGIKDIWNVVGLKKLELFGLKKQHFADGEVLSSVEQLTIGNTAISNLDILKKCKKLKCLKLIGMSTLEDFSFLEELPQLTHLDVKANKLKDFSVFRSLTNLENCFIESKIGEAELSDFDNMKKLQNFKVIGNDKLLSIMQMVRTNSGWKSPSKKHRKITCS